MPYVQRRVSLSETPVQWLVLNFSDRIEFGTNEKVKVNLYFTPQSNANFAL